MNQKIHIEHYNKIYKFSSYFLYSIWQTIHEIWIEILKLFFLDILKQIVLPL